MKKFIRAVSVALALGATVASVGALGTSAAEFEEYYPDKYAIYGDANSDSKITVKDATAIQKYLAHMNELGRREKQLADVDANGKITIGDATDVQKFIANIISCFDADPAESYTAGDESLRLEIEADIDKKVYVKIPEDGFYRVMLRYAAGNSGEFYLYDDTMKYITDAWATGSVSESYVYLESGKYILWVSSEYIGESCVADLSVTLRNDKVPVDSTGAAIDIDNAVELKAGDVINVTAGEATPVYKLSVDASGVFVHTEGKNPKVSYKMYTTTLGIVRESKGEDTNISFTRFSNIEYSSAVYLVFTQAEGGTDYTLYCEDYFETVKKGCVEISLDTPVKPEMKMYREDLYYAELNYSFTPIESGYYKLCGEGAELAEMSRDNMYYDKNAAGDMIFSKFSMGETGFDCMQYLEAGKTYYVSLQPYYFEDAPLTVTLSKASEEEYNLWAKAFEATDDEADFNPECEAINLGDKIYISLKSLEETEDYVFDSKMFKFTAEEDMSVVICSEDSINAVVEILNEDGEFIFVSYGSGNFSSDFTVLGTFKAGESCYIDVSSMDYYGDGYYLYLVPENEYTPVK